MLTQILNLTGGADTSDLPAGFVPLPSSLYQEAQADIREWILRTKGRRPLHPVRHPVRHPAPRLAERRAVGHRVGELVRIIGNTNGVWRFGFCVGGFDPPNQRAGATDGARCADQRQQRGGGCPGRPGPTVRPTSPEIHSPSTPCPWLPATAGPSYPSHCSWGSWPWSLGSILFLSRDVRRHVFGTMSAASRRIRRTSSAARAARPNWLNPAGDPGRARGERGEHPVMSSSRRAGTIRRALGGAGKGAQTRLPSSSSFPLMLSARRAPIRKGGSKRRVKNVLVGEPGPAFRVDPDWPRSRCATGADSLVRPAGAWYHDHRRDKPIGSCRPLLLTFVTLGLCLIAFVAYAFLFTGLQEQREQHALLNDFVTPDKTSLFSGHVPAEGQPAAVLAIPAIGLHQVVVEGTSAADLAKGPGVMIGTARPGTKGNAVIAGRLTTSGAPFADLTLSDKAITSMW